MPGHRSSGAAKRAAAQRAAATRKAAARARRKPPGGARANVPAKAAGKAPAKAPRTKTPKGVHGRPVGLAPFPRGVALGTTAAQRRRYFVALGPWVDTALRTRFRDYSWSVGEVDVFCADVAAWLGADAAFLAKTAGRADGRHALIHALDAAIWAISGDFSPQGTLARFSAQVFGDDHRLDHEKGHPTAVLFYRYLRWRALEKDEKAEIASRQAKAVSWLDAAVLLDSVDIVRNPLASGVTASGLDSDDATLRAAWAATPAVVLTRRDADLFATAKSRYHRLFVVENLSTLHDLMARLEAGDLDRARWPTMLCTDGHRSFTALALLIQLAKRAPTLEIFHSTDGDRSGRAMHAALVRAFPAQVRRWGSAGVEEAQVDAMFPDVLDTLAYSGIPTQRWLAVHRGALGVGGGRYPSRHP